MLILKEPIDKVVTASSGSWSGNTQKINGGILLHVVVQAESSDTTFDFEIVDESGITIKSWTANTEELNEEVYIPISGVLTLEISNSSADEDFNIYLGIDES